MHGQDDVTNVRIRPITKKVIWQDGVEYTNEVSKGCGGSTIYCFDSFARPTQVRRHSPFGDRTDRTTYYDQREKWILGQVASVTCIAPASCKPATAPDGLVEVETTYDSVTALPLSTKSFGRLTQALEYNADGTVAVVRDGNLKATQLQGWKRGVPTTIRYPSTPDSPQGATRSAMVDDNGWIQSVTDELAYTTHYAYDLAGRLTKISYPTGDTVTWADTNIAYSQSTSQAYGLPVGHWMRRRWTNAGNHETYYDAQWRPVIERRYGGNLEATQSFIVQRYDAKGRLAFQSYPVATLSSYLDSALKGVETFYDDLNRVVRTTQHSELWPLHTTTDYSDGKTKTRTPRFFGTNVFTETSYMAFDDPSTDLPLQVKLPEEAYIDITRDPFGKPLSLTRRDQLGTADNTIVRRYHYDASQRLCKTEEPETGASLQALDGTGNIVWTATGLPAGVACASGGQAVERTYDGRNRLLSLNFPDGRGDTSYTYKKDGLLASVSTSNPAVGSVTTFYDYNRRRMLQGEGLQVDEHAWELQTHYDWNGHVSGITYPDGTVVDFGPDALGRPLRAGTFAHSTTYWPNGAAKSFRYGNGIEHTMEQNDRLLPEVSIDSGVLHDEYDYDANGNVVAITDGAVNGRGNRGMVYDDLDRLVLAESKMFGTDGAQGVAEFTYDVLDNLRTFKMPQTLQTTARDRRYCYDNLFRLTFVRTSPSCNSGGASIALSYDERGNVASKNSHIFDFDYGNRLRSMRTSQSSSPVELYAYDGHGRRVMATHAIQGTIWSMYGQDGVLRYQRNERTGKDINYITHNGSLVAQASTAFGTGVPGLSAPAFVAVPKPAPYGNYDINWTAVESATSYQLQESMNGGAWSQWSTTATTRSFTDKRKGVHVYRVRACSPVGCGGWSPATAVYVQRAPDTMPALTVPQQAPGGSYTVAWSTVDGALTYRLEESINGSAWSEVYDGDNVAKGYAGRAAGSYSYRVRGCNPAGCSETSPMKTAQVYHVPGGSPFLTLPSNSISGAFTVSWTAVPGATLYRLEERFNTGPWHLMHNETATTISLAGRTSGQYSYRVSACNAAGCGPLSQIAVVKVLTVPSAPVLTAPTSSTTGNYNVGWAASATATSYRLEEGMDGGAWSQVYSGAERSYAASGRPSGTFSYRVKACNDSGCGSNSAIDVTNVLVPPLTPNITSSTKFQSHPGAGPIRILCAVAWTERPTAETYELKVPTSGITQYSGPNTGVSSSSGSFCAPTHVVRACNTSGCSAWSNPPFPQVLTIGEPDGLVADPPLATTPAPAATGEN